MSLADVGSDRSALDRMRRTMYLAVGVSAALFGALQASGPNGFMVQMGQLRAPFGAITVTVAIVLPASFAILGFILPARVMRVLVTSAAIAFILCQVLFVPAMIPAVLADHAAPWFQGFGAIPATLLAVAWPRRFIWVFPLAQGPLVAVVEWLARGEDGGQALLDGMGALVTCLILTGVAIAVVTAAAQLDVVAARAGREASLEATLRTREREQSRINAIVHDDIMSVLLAASRVPAPPQLAAQAQHALATIAAVDREDTEALSYAPADVAAVVRATIGEIGDDFAFTSRLNSSALVPGIVVAALAEASAEAARNSVLHAGDHARRWTTVSISDEDIEVVIGDDGHGFAARQVSERRLGLRTSIIGRMRALPGGGALVNSKPGAGATVALRWHREPES